MGNRFEAFQTVQRKTSSRLYFKSLFLLSWRWGIIQACPSVLGICGAHLELTGLVRSMRNADFIIASAQLCWKALLLYSFTASGSYTIHLCLFQPWSLILEWRCDLDFPVRVVHSSVSDSLHLVLPWASVLIAISCKIKLLWWGFREEFNS